MLPTKLAEGAYPGHCCGGSSYHRLLYLKLHATIMCHQFTEVFHWPGKGLALAPLTSLFISSLIHATIIYHCLIVPGTVLETYKCSRQYYSCLHGHYI